MSQSFLLTDRPSVGDLTTYLVPSLPRRGRLRAPDRGLRRSRRVHGDPLPPRPPRRDARRFSACAPSRWPTSGSFDAVVPSRSLLDRLARVESAGGDGPAEIGAAPRGRQRHVGGHLAAPRRLARSGVDGCRAPRTRGPRRHRRDRRRRADGHRRAAGDPRSRRGVGSTRSTDSSMFRPVPPSPRSAWASCTPTIP